MTTLEISNERIAAAVLNNAIEYGRTRPSAEQEPVEVELKKLAPTGDGLYAVVSNGTVSRVPTLVAENPTRLVGSSKPGEEMRLLMEAVSGEGDGASIPTHRLWELLSDWAINNRPTVGECRTLSRGLNTLAAVRKGVVLGMGDLT